MFSSQKRKRGGSVNDFNGGEVMVKRNYVVVNRRTGTKFTYPLTKASAIKRRKELMKRYSKTKYKPLLIVKKRRK